MGPAVYVIAILGCGEGDAPCRELALARPRFESEAACTAATEAQLMRHAGADYPVIVAQCRPADADARPVLASEVRLPPPEANPHFPPAPAEESPAD